jgi:hypothetical protein
MGTKSEAERETKRTRERGKDKEKWVRYTAYELVYDGRFVTNRLQ